MSRFLVLGFEYNGAVDYCLIRYKRKEDYNEYAITIMNGELEKILFGKHIMIEKNGYLQLETTDNEEQDYLKEQVAKALGELLGIFVKRVSSVK